MPFLFIRAILSKDSIDSLVLYISKERHVHNVQARDFEEGSGYICDLSESRGYEPSLVSGEIKDFDTSLLYVCSGLERSHSPKGFSASLKTLRGILLLDSATNFIALMIVLAIT